MIETVRFELEDNVDELAFMAEIESTKPVLSALDGFVKRCVAKSDDGTWIDMLEWESEFEFQRLNQLLSATPELSNYVSMINLGSLTSQAFELEARFFSA